ncbi:MAG: hypothetical protein AAFQ53_12010 [Bacteroidota bacterium]
MTWSVGRGKRLYATAFSVGYGLIMWEAATGSPAALALVSETWYGAIFMVGGLFGLDVYQVKQEGGQ